MIELTEQQRHEVRHQNSGVIDVTDPDTKEEFILIRKEIYQRLKCLLYDDHDLTAEHLKIQLAQAAEANGWNESAMDAYDDYDLNRAKLCQ
jgi:hypothetical protein